MKAKQFVEYLNSLISNDTNSMVKEILDRMKIKPKKHQTAYNDELSYLINNFEMEGVEIGMICFLGEYKITSNHYIFGNIDMDYIGFDTRTREIVLLDHDQIDFVMMKCAKNSIVFLQLLKSYSEYVIHGLLKKEVLQRDLNSIYTEVGGIEYKNFIDFLFPPAKG